MTEVDDGTDDAVFKALADPTRRALLDALFLDDGQTLTELCGHAPALTRFGVMKHLAVLGDAGLITERRDGRTKRHFLNPIPIARIAGRWIDKYADPFVGAMVGLQLGFESTPTNPGKDQA